MMALQAPVTCPTCAGTVAVLQSARPTMTEASALLTCSQGHRWQALMRLLAVPADPVGAARRREQRGRVSAHG